MERIQANGVGISDFETTKRRTHGDSVQFSGECSTSQTRWRRGWDSNPRATFAAAGFQDRCLQPLGHPSKPYKSSTYTILILGASASCFSAAFLVGKNNRRREP